MNDSHYGVLCAVLLGLGQLAMFTGYDTQSFVVEPVLHSVHARTGAIDAHAGYYSQAVISAFYTIANLLAPCILMMLGSKLTLVIGSAGFTMYMCAFFYINFATFYGASAILGFCYALFYAGYSAYLTEHSSRKTIERNSAIVWAIGTSSMIVGGIIMIFTTRAGVQAHEAAKAAANTTLPQGSSTTFRIFEDSEIRLLYGVFAIFGLVSNIIYGAMPRRAVQQSLDEVGAGKHGSVASHMKSVFRTMRDRRILMLSPAFLMVGTSTTFMLTIYPTAVQFTKELTGEVYLPAMISFVVGIGEVSMSIIISFASRRIQGFGMKPTLAIGFALNFTAMMLVLLSSPFRSSIEPTTASSILIKPSAWLTLFILFLLGLSDAAYNTSRTVLCAVLMPGLRAQSFCISKFYQALAQTLLFFFSPFLTIPMHFAIHAINNVVAIVLYFKVASRARKLERRVSIISAMSAFYEIPECAVIEEAVEYPDEKIESET